MTALLGMQLRRLLARRLLRIFAVVLVLGVLTAPVLVDWAFRERTRIERDADIETCVAGEEPRVRDGEVVPTIPESVPPTDRPARCEAAIPERSGAFRLVELEDVLRSVGSLLVIGAFVIGASMVGADWQAGFVATLLTWEARRTRVFLAGVLAVAGLALVGVALWQALLGAVVTPFAAARDLTAGADGTWWLDTSALGLRIAAIAAGAAATGYAIAQLGRSTAAALGGGLAYVLVLESALGSNFRPLRPWLVLDNALVFVRGVPDADVPGRTTGSAAIVLALYLAALLVVAATVFARRDVT